MNYKKHLIVSLLFCNFTYINAQINFGLIVGANFSNIEYELDKYDNKNVNNYKKPSFGISISKEITKNILFHSKILYNQKGYIKTIEDNFFKVNRKIEFNPNYLDIPLNLILKFDLAEEVNFKFGFGGFLSFGINGKTTVTEERNGNTEIIEYDFTFDPSGTTDYMVIVPEYFIYDISKINYGINLTSGIGFRSLSLDFDFLKGLKNIVYKTYFTSKNEEWMHTNDTKLTLTYYFNK